MNQHLLDVVNFKNEDIMSYISKARDIKMFLDLGNNLTCLKGKILACLFFEPSTRTSCSFQAAMLKMGGSVISVTDKYSSVEKGETMEDTIHSLGCYADAIVLRHPLKGSSHLAASISNVPIINAGDGNGEHPTQALLDIFTIYSELGSLDNELVITFLGDLKNSRTIHSLIRVLCLFPKMKFIYISPDSLEMPSEIVSFVEEKGIEQVKSMSLEEAIKEADVLYVTRIQKERFTDISLYSTISKYCVDAALMSNAKEKMIVMHPLPRNQEIAVEVDKDPRAVYFKQMKYGLYMRMAILNTLMH